MKMHRVAGVMIGGIFGFLVSAVYSFTEESSSTYRLANLANALAELAICIPGLLAPFAKWKLLLPSFAIGYWALIGILFGWFPKKWKLFVILILLVHISVLLVIDLLINSVSIQSF